MASPVRPARLAPALLLVAGCTSGRVPAEAPAPGAPPAQTGPNGTDTGACLSGAKSWDHARAWASSFRVPARTTERAKVEILESELPIAATKVRVLAQLETYERGGLRIARQFVFVEPAPHAITGCAVSEQRVEDFQTMRTTVRLETEALDWPGADGSIIGVHANLDAPSALEARALCKLSSGSMGCVTFDSFFPEGEVLRVTNDAVWYAFGPEQTRAKLPLRAGESRRVDGERLFAIAGRSTAWREAHPAESPVADGGQPLTPATEQEARSLKGSFEDRGTCIARASDLETAKLWMESFRSENDQREAGKPDDIARSLRMENLNGVAAGRKWFGFVQTTRLQMALIDRHFIVAQGPEGVAACLVSEDWLEYGYTQSPTPKGAVEEHGKDAVTYAAHHTWHDASGNEEQADWRVFCTLRSGELGCLSAITRWVEQELDKDRSPVFTPKTSTATLAWKGDQLEWQSAGKTVRAKLAPGISASIDRGTHNTLSGRGTLKP